MAGEQIPYTAVLADLEHRRDALNSRLKSIDAAIDGLRALLEDAGSSATLTVGVLPPKPPQQSLPPGRPPVSRTPGPPRAGLGPRTPLPPPRSRTAVPPAMQSSAVAPNLASPVRAAVDRRKRTGVSGLTVYVNEYPEWSQKIAHGNPNFRKTTSPCPKCGSTDTRESGSRGITDFVMFLFDYTNARCRSCGSRFRVWKPRPSQGLEESPAME